MGMDVYSFPIGIQATRPVSDFSSICLVIIVIVISLFVNLCVSFSSQFNDLDRLKALLTTSALIDGKVEPQS